jgi:hypothetical protein
MAPEGTSKDAAETAFRPRNDLDIPSTRSIYLPNPSLRASGGQMPCGRNMMTSSMTMP